MDSMRDRGIDILSSGDIFDPMDGAPTGELPSLRDMVGITQGRAVAPSTSGKGHARMPRRLFKMADGVG